MYITSESWHQKCPSYDIITFGINFALIINNSGWKIVNFDSELYISSHIVYFLTMYMYISKYFFFVLLQNLNSISLQSSHSV